MSMHTSFRLIISALIVCCTTVGLQAQEKIVVKDSGYFTSFDQTEIYYETYGTGFPVLLVHGFIVNSNSWKRSALFDSLMAAGNKVILIDLRGNGKSSKPHNDDAYKSDAEAKDIVALMNYLKIKSYDAVGYSRGSIITARLLLKDKRIHKAILGGMGTDFTDTAWQRPKQFYEAFTFDTVKSLHNVVENIRRSQADIKALALLQKYQPFADSADLKKNKVPVLVLRGTEDQYSEGAERLASFFRKGEFENVPGDHDHVSYTSDFANAAMKFLMR